MKSRTRKAKSRVLIAFGEGIASSFAIELAMFFCHAGYEVKSALIDRAGDWVCQAPLKQICSSPVLTSEHRPPWFYNHQTFDLTMIVNPSALAQHQILEGNSPDPVIEYIIQKGGLINFLQPRACFAAEGSYDPARFFFRELATQPLHIGRSFHNAFASATALLAGRKALSDKHFAISFSSSEQSNNDVAGWPDWICKLKDALLQSGLTISKHDSTADLTISAYDSSHHKTPVKFVAQQPAESGRNNLSVVFIDTNLEIATETASENHLLVQRMHNGLRVFNSNGVRFLPELTSHCAYSRLALMLVNLLQRNTFESATGQSNDLC